jgi:hypothetical protein
LPAAKKSRANHPPQSGPVGAAGPIMVAQMDPTFKRMSGCMGERHLWVTRIDVQPSERRSNACTTPPMAETWLSYADIAKALGTSPEAARQKAIRDRWRR